MWRRRYCEKCGRTFTTRENVELGFLEVTKLNGSLEPFSRSKLLHSVINACNHMPEHIDSSSALTETIEKNILSALEKDSDVVTTSVISEITASVLKKYDPLAHLKYVAHKEQSPTSKRQIKALIKGGN